MNEREVASIVAVIAAAFPQWPATKETVAIYADALSDVDYNEARKAIREIILTEDRWPTVARIRRQVAHRLGLLAPSSAEAWSEVNSACATSGANVRQTWSHPVLAETVNALGWYNICASTNRETLRAQFTRSYEDSQKRHDVDVLLTKGRIGLNGSRDSISAGQSVALPE